MKVSLGKGSSRDLFIDSEHPGYLGVEFSDRVSVFDYGALPDSIPHKGSSILLVAEALYKNLNSHGILTSYDQTLNQSRKHDMLLKAAKHPRFVVNGASLEFLPVEIIFRWGVTPGSSLLKRKPKLNPYETFAEPVIEFTTKLESTDRLLDEAETKKLVGGDDVYFKLVQFTSQVALHLKNYFQSCGLKLWDGKIECGLNEQKDIVLLDPLGPDELRVTLPGLEKIPLSKELLRQWLGKTSWAFDIAQCKASLGTQWKKQVSAPPRLGSWRVDKLTSLYVAFASSVTDQSPVPLLKWARADEHKPRVFVIGSGGREEAQKQRLKEEGAMIVAAADSADAVWVSKDQDLSLGIANEYQRQGFWVFGPTMEASKVEWSKQFGHEVASAAGIPRARTSMDPAELRSFQTPPVIKMDGLAAGKGVVIPKTWEEAEKALKEMDEVGSVVMEERLEGYELSAFFALRPGSQGIETMFLGTAQDFKRRFLGDEGPNTGGMGSYSPHPKVSQEDIILFKQWATATAKELENRKLPYNGILYLGCIKDKSKGWMLLEYNARFGDPETQALVNTWGPRPVLRSILGLSMEADVSDVDSQRVAFCLSLVTPAYPGNSAPVTLPPWNPANDSLKMYMSGSLTGRVAYLVGTGDSLQDAGDHVFEALVESPWKNILEWRSDIFP